MSFQTSKTVPLPVLRDKLKAVVSKRGSIYQMISAIILTFEDDDSGAQEDAVTLENCFRDVFGITDITKLVFEGGDKTPAWTLMDVLRGAITRIGDTKSLLIIAYIGHGSIDPVTDTLRLESGKANIQWKPLHDFFMMPNDLLATIDCLAIFDCCYAGAAVRSVSETTSKLIAACGKHETARNCRYNSISFTQRLCRAIRNLATEKAYMSSEEIIAEVQRQKPQGAPFALHVDIAGLNPLVLPVAKRKSSLSKQEPLSKPQSVLVELSVSGGPNDEVFRGFQEVIRTLPPDFRITIVDAYESSSVLFILRMSWKTFLRFENVIELHVIGVVTGTSLLPVATSQPLPNMPLANLTNRQRDHGENK
ncbi:hypothetical protein Egran_01191 [Elaphomyces granulatus]|uniref:Uncharacterized protein n=1 Tax=Elaphomyces granulatus TaxID=519963 RepID=A0A232M3X5_9EURO|nr:hypothetical protein Egran_01191 [Elaphomyces granulatus]